MTNQTMLSLLNYLCNVARNSAHASLRLTHADAQMGLDNSTSSADQLLRSIDNIRELLSTDTPTAPLAEEFDVTLCLGEIIDVLNLASQGEARLILQLPEQPLIGMQQRRGVEQALTGILDAIAKLGSRGEARVTAAPSANGSGFQFEIVPANSNVAQRVAEWLNADPEQVNFGQEDEVLFGLPTLVAGKRLRALAGTAELITGAPIPSLVISLPWVGQSEGDYQPQPCQHDPTALNILVAEDSDDSFRLTGLLLEPECVWRARHGHEALAMMKTRRFDMVLMDIHMPGMDGYKTIRSMREWETHTGNARTSIVVLSTDDVDTQMRSAAQSGCSGFLRKPLDDHSLQDLLGHLKADRVLSA